MGMGKTYIKDESWDPNPAVTYQHPTHPHRSDLLHWVNRKFWIRRRQKRFPKSGNPVCFTPRVALINIIHDDYHESKDDVSNP
uniref:Uncharacterized protein n=1 Tax=Romanomermis culicivorax TaxID=13658 RepID=A0A915JZQ4_ROMCU